MTDMSLPDFLKAVDLIHDLEKSWGTGVREFLENYAKDGHTLDEALEILTSRNTEDRAYAKLSLQGETGVTWHATLQEERRDRPSSEDAIRGLV